MFSKKLDTLWQLIKIVLQKIFAARFWKFIPLITLVFISVVVWYNWQTVYDHRWSWGSLIGLGKAFALYPVSLLLVLINWNDIMRKLGVSIKTAQNSYVYCVNVINRRLPMGLFWSAGGRISAYHKQGISARVVTSSLSIEFLLHGFSAFVLWGTLEVFGYGYIPTLMVIARGKIINVIVGSLIFFSIVILLLLRYRKWFRGTTPLNQISGSYWAKWMLLYSATWVNAGVMLFFVIQSVSVSTITIERTIATWAVVGVIGYIFSTFPFVDIGSKELSLAFLLSQSMSLMQSILVAIIFRLLLTIADAIWPLSFAVVLHIYNQYKEDIQRNVFQRNAKDK